MSEIRSVAPADWNRLCPDKQPFVRHEFLAALEHEACVTPETGWEPHHLTLRDGAGKLVAAMPLYLKHHSWGEFVFDFAWAQAYAKAGLDYYPKLLSMSPFTPVTGARLLGSADPTSSAFMLTTLVQHAIDLDVSSVHVLYPPRQELAALERHNFLLRQDCRFLWTNHGYTHFDDFLGALRSARRKKIRRERRRVAEQGIEVTTQPAVELDANEWRAVYAMTSSTFLRRGHAPYLSPGFFRAVSAAFGDSMLVNVARLDDQVVGAAILFRDDDQLYGRYWGSTREFDCLHFETCYYRSIEYCIEHKLTTFDPGTQGEHKVTRGFAPVPTYSAHWIADRRFRSAIARYLTEETAQVDRYMKFIARNLPFRERA